MKNFFTHLIKLEQAKEEYLRDHLTIFPELSKMMLPATEASLMGQIKQFLHESNFIVTNKEMHFFWKSFNFPKEFNPDKSSYDEFVAFINTKF